SGIGVPVGHSTWNAPASAVTGSSPLMGIAALGGTFVAGLTGLVVGTDRAGSPVVKLEGWSATSGSGGSALSASGTWAAARVTVQLDVAGRFAFGVSVIVLVPLPPSEYGWAAGQAMVNELVVTSTGSLKVTVMVALTATSVALFTGLVVVTVGA